MKPFDIKPLLRPHIINLIPYSSARDEFTGTASVFLDANENPHGSVGGGDFNRYPDPHQTAIKQRLAVQKGLGTDSIFIGNGSDEVIDLLMRAFCRPAQDNIITLPPTYGMYRVSADVNDVAIQEVVLDTGFQPDLAALKAAINANTKLIFFCSPNNPTGNDIDREAIQEVLEEFNGLVVVDEAYIDFSDNPSLVSWIDEHPQPSGDANL